MSNQSMEFCSKCQDHTLHIYPSTSHVLHFLLTLCTFGLWIFIWILMGMNNKTAGQCSQCGANKGLFFTTGGKKSSQVSPDTHLKCPDCRELVLKDARKCKHCGCALVPQA